jgi:hypothetical protein
MAGKASMRSLLASLVATMLGACDDALKTSYPAGYAGPSDAGATLNGTVGTIGDQVSDSDAAAAPDDSNGAVDTAADDQITDRDSAAPDANTAADSADDQITDRDSAAPDANAAADSAADQIADRDSAPAPVCCPIDERLTCDCRQTGGTRPWSGVCPAVCDAVPIVVKRFVDENGCPEIELSKMSCLDVPDGSTGN